MPDDRPLSRDLPVGTKLQHAVTGREVTLAAQAHDGARRPYWLIEPQFPLGFIWDSTLDAPDSPWSIIPAATCSHGKTVDEYCKWCFYDDVMPDDSPCTHGPMCQWCKPTGPRAERQPIVPALPSDVPPAEQLGTCADHPMPHLGGETCMDWKPGGSVEGEPPVESPLNILRGPVELNGWDEDDEPSRVLLDRPVFASLLAEVERLAAYEPCDPCKAEDHDNCTGACTSMCCALADAEARLSRLEAVAEAARVQHYEREHRPGYCRCGAGDECPIFHALATLDTSVVVPDADGGQP